MAYNSAHTGAEIDASVEMLAQIQTARDETGSNADAVKKLSAEVKTNAAQVQEQSQGVTRSATQVAQQAQAVAADRQVTQEAADLAQEAKLAVADDRNTVQQNTALAENSARAAQQSQIAAGLSEQVTQEASIFIVGARASVAESVAQVAADRASVERNASAAAASEAKAAAVVTGGTASFQPEPGKMPIADGAGTIHDDWLSRNVARTSQVDDAASQAREAARQVSELDTQLNAVKQEVDKSTTLANYDDLRAYIGTAAEVTLTQGGIAGTFRRLIGSGKGDNGGTYIVGGNGSVWERIFNGLIHAIWFEGQSDLQIIQRVIDAVLAIGGQEAVVSREYVCVGALKNRTNVRFLGTGQLSGNASYRVRVIPESAPTSPPTFHDLEPARHLKTFSNTRAPVVVLTGSSTGTWNPNTVDTGGGVAAMLSLRIRQLNPDKKITFHNRCIGGQTFANLNDKPTVFPSWYTDSRRAWIDYLSDVKPDVIYIIMGSNDSGNISNAALTSAVAKMKGFAKVPDLVFITQPSVCADPNAAFASYGSYDEQEGRDFAAGLVRSFALYNDYGLIDGNRMGGIVIDGRDILATAMKRLAASVAAPNGMYICPVTAHDFAMNLAFVGDAAANNAAFSMSENPNNPPIVRVGAGGSNGSSGDIVQIRKDSNGFFVFQCYCGGVNYQTINTTIPFPAGSFNLEVIKSGVWLAISLDGQQDTTRTAMKLMTHGGQFYPLTRYYDLDTGPWARVNHVNLGEPLAYRPQLTSAQAWGAPNPTATTSLPYGGNGLNHFSSKGTALIYGPLIDGDNLQGTQYGSGTYIPMLSNLQNLSVAVPRDGLMYSRVGSLVSVSGCITLTPVTESTLTQLLLSIPIPSDFTAVTDAAGFCSGVQEPMMTGVIWSDPTTDSVLIQFKSTVKVAVQVRISFAYQIK
ncbi:hypothetical protein [Pseudomonas sp. KCJK9111]|uniref:hypothetical protein n=1 Tax=Pseudomonas sp. KCJK9111 TaxID=3344555 RepID=UPI003905BAA4